jgi:hypothetical protein
VYEGTIHPSNNVLGPLMDSGSLTSNGLEGLAIFDFPVTWPVQPFIFGGVGWDHWSLSGAAVHDPLAVRGTDNTMVIPFGGGIGWELMDHFTLDGRFTYRAEVLDDMLTTNGLGQTNTGSHSLGNWVLGAQAGYTF